VRSALAGEIVVSTQVLAEFAATLLHKMSPAAPPEDVAAVLDALGPIGVVVPDGDLVRRAVQARRAYGIHFYDGMIVAAAERGGCERLWSADLNSGQQYSASRWRIHSGNAGRLAARGQCSPRARATITPSALATTRTDTLRPAP